MNPQNHVKTCVRSHVYHFREGGLSIASRRLKASGREEGKKIRSFIENLLVSEKYTEDILEQKCLQR